MLRQIKTRLHGLPAIVIALLLLLAAAMVLLLFWLIADHVYRCHGEPLQREEAFERAAARLYSLSCWYDLKDAPAHIVGEQYEQDTKTWMFTFQNGDCTVSIIADRCQGTDVGGMSFGCVQRNRKKDGC